MTDILLIDNGSKRASATLQLRRVAQQLSQRLGQTVHPVSLQHADKISPQSLNGEAALTLPTFLRQRAQQGHKRFLLLPLFFGASRALSSFVPQTVLELQQDFADLTVQMAAPLCPLPEGDALLTELLWQQLQALSKPQEQDWVLVDHGSPIPQVTAVRQHLARALAQRSQHPVAEAVMERRPGEEYDFNGPLLEDWLTAQAAKGRLNIIIVMLFLLPGRHAGTDGDVEEICQRVQQHYPGLTLQLTPLVSEHPLLIDLLEARYRSTLTA